MTAAFPLAFSLGEIKIRHLVQNDLPALEWEGEFTHFRRLFERAYRMGLEGKTVLWVAVTPNHELIGQIFVQLMGTRLDLADGKRTAYLYSIRVKPAYRGIGLGTKLMQHAESDLIDRGYSRTTLNVTKDNLRGQKFYRENGYRIVAPEEGKWSYRDHKNRYRHVHEPSWRMEKRLAE